MPTLSKPWFFPIPVRKSSFIPVFDGDEQFNIETDAAAFPPYEDLRPAEWKSRVAYADLQRDPSSNLERRLGSGRSVFYRGHYLKGVGRTFLAGNWLSDDLYHNSGILYASAAAREFLVSAYLSGRGAGKAIVPCEGILVRALPRRFRDHTRRVFSLRESQMQDFPGMRADRHLQAISVKPANFVRFSNLEWWLAHYPQDFRVHSERPLARFFSELRGALRDPEVSADASPEELAAALRRACERNFACLHAAWARGVHWGSLHNNFALDGRFLDLEVPIVLPHASFGLHYGLGMKTLRERSPMDAEDFRPWLGFEPVHVARQLLLAFRSLARWMDVIDASGHFLRIERKFAGRFARALTRFPRDHWLASEKAFLERYRALYLSGRDWREKDRALVFRALASETGSLDFGKGPGRRRRAPSIRLHRVTSFALSPGEPQVPVELWIPDFLRERYESDSGDARALAFNAWMHRLAAETRPAGFLAKLRAAHSELSSRA